MTLKAHHLLKQNIDTLLKARGQKRKELAAWCRRSESWLSQIFIDEDRNVPLKYLDRIADFFGLATYQLFQPGISPLTERRRDRERRSGLDRRISRAAEIREQAPSMVELTGRMRQLSPEAYRRFARRVEAALTLAAPPQDDEDLRDHQDSSAPLPARAPRTRRKS